MTDTSKQPSNGDGSARNVASSVDPLPSHPSPTPSHPLWLDVDPGHDDALALILATHCSNRLRVVGVSTVGGNQSLVRTTRNALHVLASIDRAQIPVHPGRDQPLRRKAVPQPDIHGTSGLEGSSFPPLQTRPSPVKAWDALAHALRTTNEPVTICATGPLTNIALFLLAYPEFLPKDPQHQDAEDDEFDMPGSLKHAASTSNSSLPLHKRIRQISIMGGALGIGNTSPAAEFNIQLDPEAADIVFNSGVEVTMVPLEVTHTALVTEEVLRRIAELAPAIPSSSSSSTAASDHSAQSSSANSASTSLSLSLSPSPTRPLTPFLTLIFDLLLFFRDSYSKVFHFREGPPLHDPCAVFYLLRPEAFECQWMHVSVDCGEGICSGRTVADVYGYGIHGSGLRADAPRKNVRVAMKMDVDQFWAEMLEALKSADRVSVLNRPTTTIQAKQQTDAAVHALEGELEAEEVGTVAAAAASTTSTASNK